MPTSTYFTDQMLAKPSAEQVREHIQANILPTSDTIPADPVPGQIYLNTLTNTFVGWNGTAWVALS